MSKCKIISVANQKGGVGKTTTTFHLGVGLGLKGFKVLLVDLDAAQQNLTYSTIGELGTDKPGVIYALEHETTQPNLEELISKTRFQNVDILPAEKLQGYDVEQSISQHMRKEEKIKRLLSQKHIDNYDFVIIDTPPKLGSLLINAFVASDFVVVTMKAGALERKGVKDLFSTVDAVKEMFNKDLEIISFLITMESARSADAKAVKKEIKENMGDIIVDSIRPNVQFTRLPAEQLSIYEIEEKVKVKGKFVHGNGFEDYSRFVDQIIERVTKVEVNPIINKNTQQISEATL